MAKLGDIIGGIIGAPGKIVGGTLGAVDKTLEATGLGGTAEILIDSLNDQGQISVSSLLDIGGERTRKKQLRELQLKSANLQLKQQEQSLVNAILTGDTNALGLEQAKQDVQLQDTDRSVSEFQALNPAPAPEPTGFLRPNAVQENVAANAAAGQQIEAEGAAQNRAAIEATVARKRERAGLLNKTLVEKSGMTPEDAAKFTDTLSFQEQQDLMTSFATGAFQLQRSEKLAATRVAKAKTTIKVPTDFQTRNFEKGIADDIATQIGAIASVESDEGGFPKQKRATGAVGFTRKELAILPRSKEFGRQVLQTTRSTTVSNAAAVDNFLLNHPTRARFDLLGNLGTEDKLVTKDPFDFGTGARDEIFGQPGVGPVDDKVADALLSNMAKNVNRTRVIWSGVGNQLDDANKQLAAREKNAPFIEPFSVAYYLNWNDALNKVPGWNAEFVKNPKTGGVSWQINTGDDQLDDAIEQLIQGG